MEHNHPNCSEHESNILSAKGSNPQDEKENPHDEEEIFRDWLFKNFDRIQKMYENQTSKPLYKDTYIFAKAAWNEATKRASRKYDPRELQSVLLMNERQRVSLKLMKEKLESILAGKE